MSIIAAGTTTTTALSSTGNTDGTLQLQVNGTTPSVTLNTLGAIGVGSSPSYGTSGQVLTSAGSTAAPAWTTIASSQWTTTGSNIYYNTGNVGIGASSPDQPLVVNKTAGSNYLKLTGDNNAAYDIGMQFTDGTNQSYFGQLRGTLSGVAGALVSVTGGAIRTVLNASGNFGVGQTTPICHFDSYGSGANTYARFWRSDEAGYGGRVGTGNTLYGPASARSLGLDGYSSISIGIAGTQVATVTSSGAWSFGSSGTNTGTSGQVLTSGGSGAAPSWATPAAGGFSNMVIFTSSGTWTIPTGITKCKVTVTGAGAAGQSNGSPNQGGGGGAGGTAIGIYTLTGTTASVTVGAGGTTNAAGGGGSSFSNGGLSITGSGGGAPSSRLGGAGGNADASAVSGLSVIGGAGASGANLYASGAGGGSFWGGGGSNGADGFTSGRNGRAYGSGGGGQWNATTILTGADGVVVIEY
jgi:hypothetical protein